MMNNIMIFNSNFSISSGGDTLIIGTKQIFENAVIQDISIARLSDTKAIVCYQDRANNYAGTACILEVSGNTITVGNPIVYAIDTSTYLPISYNKVTALSESKAIVCYRDGGDNYKGKAVVLEVSGNTITNGSPILFSTSGSFSAATISVAALTTTNAIVCYHGTYGGTVVPLTVSGNSISSGTPRYFEGVNTNISFISVKKVSTSRAIVSYRHRDFSDLGRVRLLDVNFSGDSIGFNIYTDFEPNDVSENDITVLSDNKAVICYKDFFSSNTYFKTRVLDIGTSSITTNNYTLISSGHPISSMSLDTLSDSQVLVCYSNGLNNNYYGEAQLLNISGGTITLGDSSIYNNSTTSYSTLASLTFNKAIVAYQDASNSYYGVASVIEIQ